MGGPVIRGFARGETIPELDNGIGDDPAKVGLTLPDPPYLFVDGEVRTLTWSQAGSTVSEPHRAATANGVFVFATSVDERVVYGTFRLKTDPKKRTVRIRPGKRNVGRKPVVVR